MVLCEVGDLDLRSETVLGCLCVGRWVGENKGGQWLGVDKGLGRKMLHWEAQRVEVCVIGMVAWPFEWNLSIQASLFV